MIVDLSKPWQVLEGLTADEFLIGMSELGHSQEMSLVGSFENPGDTTKRTAHRDIPLPFHRDGIYTQSIADLQGGMYIERPNVDVVGMYCIRDNTDTFGHHLPCHTILSKAENPSTTDDMLVWIDLMPGQALIWDNRLWHAREGEVGKRILVRFWITCPALYEVRP